MTVHKKETPLNSLSQKSQRLSEVFSKLSQEAEGSVSLGQIIDKLGNRAFAPLLVFFSAINLIPILPPGSTAILGLPLLVLASQMLMGNKKAWLPQSFMKRSIKAETFRASMEWIIPRLQRIEKYIGPRYWPFSSDKGERLIGLIVFIMSISIVLPIPGGNWLPALSIAVIGIALLERDLILLVIGGFLSLASIALVTTILGSFGLFIQWLLNRIS